MKLPEGVGLTALVAAYARAQESRRPDRLFDDPFAVQFVTTALGAKEGGRLPRLGPASEDGDSELWKGMAALLGSRTPFYDKHIIQHIRAGCRQLVLLGAGLDARAFRLDLPDDTTVYEVDMPAVLTFKAEALAQHGIDTPVKRVAVMSDLREDWAGALTSAGFDPNRPTVWVAEGLIMYLTQSQVDVLLASITNLTAPGSLLVTEFITRRPRMTEVPLTDSQETAVAELFVSGAASALTEMPETWLSAHGWREFPHRDLADELAEFGRPVPLLVDPNRPDPMRSVLIAAEYVGAGAKDRVG